MLHLKCSPIVVLFLLVLFASFAFCLTHSLHLFCSHVNATREWECARVNEPELCDKFCDAVPFWLRHLNFAYFHAFMYTCNGQGQYIQTRRSTCANQVVVFFVFTLIILCGPRLISTIWKMDMTMMQSGRQKDDRFASSSSFLFTSLKASQHKTC